MFPLQVFLSVQYKVTMARTRTQCKEVVVPIITSLASIDENMSLKHDQIPTYETIPVRKNSSISFNIDGAEYLKRSSKYILFSLLLIISILEIVFLYVYFEDDPDAPNVCDNQQQYTYFILAKLIFTIISISWIYAVKLLESECKANSYTLYSCSLIAFTVLVGWSMVLSFQVYDYQYEFRNDERKCGSLIRFMIFELTSVYFLLFILCCMACCNWFFDHHMVYSQTYSMYA